MVLKESNEITLKENKKLYKFLKAIYSKLLKILYKPTAYGVENIPEEGPIIFVGNHRHAFDPIVVMTHTNRMVHYMAKETNSKIIPFAIRGKYRLFKNGLSIEFGKPVDVSQMEIEEANDYIRNEVLKIFRK